jgi:hypothetical protein
VTWRWMMGWTYSITRGEDDIITQNINR